MRRAYSECSKKSIVGIRVEDCYDWGNVQDAQFFFPTDFTFTEVPWSKLEYVLRTLKRWENGSIELLWILVVYPVKGVCVDNANTGQITGPLLSGQRSSVKCRLATRSSV